MNIFMYHEEYLVKKIKETPIGWNLYPVDADQKPIFISKHDYSGKMPPFFKWPWQEVKLKLTLVSDFQISATLDSHKLFEIPEKNYPERIKKILEKGKQFEQELDVTAKKRDDAIKKALTDYLKDVPINPNLEDELSTLKVCLRAYMKLHLFKGKFSLEQTQRLNLMMHICKIAQRIYTRHIDEENPFGAVLTSFKYTLTYNFPSYSERIEDYEELAKKEGRPMEIFDLYHEVDRLMTSTLPPIQDDSLKRYLNYLTREIQYLLSEDMAKLDCNHARSGYDGRRLYSDEKDYKYLYSSMKLLKYESFVLPEVFTDKIISDFIRSYNLK